MTTTLTVRLPQWASQSLTRIADDRGRELADLAATILTSYAAEYDKTDASEACLAGNTLLDEAVEKAREIVRNNQGRMRDVTREVARWIREERLPQYERAIRGDAMGSNNPHKHDFNKRLGRNIKVSLKAASIIQGNRPEVVFVSGEIIKSYTPLRTSG